MYYIWPTRKVAGVEILAILGAMMRSAILQARVRPEIKFAGEQVLRSIGLIMTEAMELFLRRLIVDQKPPFEIATLDGARFTSIVDSWKASQKEEAVYAAAAIRRKTDLQP